MKRHIIASREELKNLAQRINQKPFDMLYERLLKRCSLILETAPISEMHWQSAWAAGRTDSATSAARSSQGRIFDLAIADAIESNGAFRARAIEELTNLQNWSTWVDPCRPEMQIDRATAEASVATAIGLDWLWDFIPDDKRQEMIARLQERVLTPYLQAVQNDAWWYTSVNHWNAVLNSSAGIIALALANRDARTDETYTLAIAGLEHFFGDLGRQGGWDEGIGYWGFAMRYVLLLARAANRLADDKRIIHQRGMSQTGLFPIYFSPNGKTTSFGNFTEPPLHGSLYLFDEYFELPEISWWLDRFSFSNDITNTGWSKAGLALLFRPVEPTPQEPALETLKTFDQIGWGAIADSWPAPEFYASVKTGDLATSSSAHDMNSTQLMVKNELLLANPTTHSDTQLPEELDEFYDIPARMNNTITVGQADHMPDAQGRIIHKFCDENIRWCVCNGSTACGHDVKFHRHIIMLAKEKILVTLDHLDLPRREIVDLFWHSPGKISLDENSQSGKISGLSANLDFAVCASQHGILKQQSKPLGANRQDNFLQFTTELTGEQFIASVFTAGTPANRISLNASDPTNIELTFGEHTLYFKKDKHYLMLEK